MKRTGCTYLTLVPLMPAMGKYVGSSDRQRMLVFVRQGIDTTRLWVRGQQLLERINSLRLNLSILFVFSRERVAII